MFLFAKKITFLILVLSLCSALLQAATITYDFRDTLNKAEIDSGLMLVDGLTLTIISTQGSLNHTASSFGVNHTGGSADESALIDGDEGAEILQFSFDQDVTITQITLSSYSGSESATFTIGSFAAINLSPLAAASDIYDFTTDNTLSTGSLALLTWVSGNGFSVDSITVETMGAIVPEPSSVMLLGMSGIMLACYRSRRFEKMSLTPSRKAAKIEKYDN